MISTIKKIVTVFLLVASVSIAAQESVLLQYNFKKGDQYLIEMNLKQDMAPIMSMDIDLSMVMKSIGKDGNNLKNTYQIKRMKMLMGAQGQNIEFDSDAKDEDLSDEEKKMKAEIEPALKAIIYQTIDRTGKVVEQKMVPDVKGAMSLMNQNQFTNMEYPTTPVKVGSSWNYSQNMNGTNMKVKYTVTKITKENVFADITGEIEGVSGTEADVSIGGKTKIDRSSGMVVDMNFVMNMSASGMGIKMNVAMKSKKM